MERTDVLIVGAGPAGTACAGRLVRAGLDVTIADRAVFPRAKPCAGWLTPDVFDALALDPRHYARQCSLQPLTAFRTGLLDRALKATEFGATVSYAVRRAEFDHFLLRRSGARAELGAAVASITRAGGWWEVNGRWQARVLVGAGGHFCPVARLLGARPAREDAVIAQVAEFRMEAGEARACQARGDCPELFFLPDLKGYGWCVRKGDWLNVGLGVLGGWGGGARLEALLDTLRRARRLDGARRPVFHGHAYLLRCQSHRAPVSEGVLLAGDAAGLAGASSGEGIWPAVRSGLLAAQAILDAGGDPEKLCAEGYARALERAFGPAGGMVRPRPAGWPERQAARFVLSGPELLRRRFLERRFLRAAG